MNDEQTPNPEGAQTPPPPPASPPPAQPYGEQQYAQPYQQQPYQQPYQQQPGYYYPPQYQHPPQYQQPGQYVSYPIEPSNDAAVGSLITSLTSLGFLFLTAGVVAPLTLIASIVGIVLGRKGVKNVEEGKTAKQRDLAQGGYIMGIIGVVASVLAIVAWILVIVLIASSESIDSGQLDGLLL